MEDSRLWVEYSTFGDGQFDSCINGKQYAALKQAGYIGVSSGNPPEQNVNEIDVLSIDFFNMNSMFYQHDAEEIVENQQYYKRDETGFVGMTQYPWSGKLNTLALGEVAFDVFEAKRH